MLRRAILCPYNEGVDEINDKLIDSFPGEEFISYSADQAEHDSVDVPIEYLNSIRYPGLPLHELRLKINMPVMLLRNIDRTNGLCNGTRLIVKGRRGPVLMCFNPKSQKKILLPRIVLHADVTKTSFKWRRRQFPVQVTFAVTINKSQG
ncbi:MAG: hypothetical protein ACREBR_00090 [bacterium]